MTSLLCCRTSHTHVINPFCALIPLSSQTCSSQNHLHASLSLLLVPPQSHQKCNSNHMSRSPRPWCLSAWSVLQHCFLVLCVTLKQWGGGSQHTFERDPNKVYLCLPWCCYALLDLNRLLMPWWRFCDELQSRGARVLLGSPTFCCVLLCGPLWINRSCLSYNLTCE